jgi:hypothetical protein
MADSSDSFPYKISPPLCLLPLSTNGETSHKRKSIEFLTLSLFESTHQPTMVHILELVVHKKKKAPNIFGLLLLTIITLPYSSQSQDPQQNITDIITDANVVLHL